MIIFVDQQRAGAAMSLPFLWYIDFPLKADARFGWHTSFQFVIKIYLTYGTEILIVQQQTMSYHTRISRYSRLSALPAMMGIFVSPAAWCDEGYSHETAQNNLVPDHHRRVRRSVPTNHLQFRCQPAEQKRLCRTQPYQVRSAQCE